MEYFLWWSRKLCMYFTLYGISFAACFHIKMCLQMRQHINIDLSVMKFKSDLSSSSLLSWHFIITHSDNSSLLILTIHQRSFWHFNSTYSDIYPDRTNCVLLRSYTWWNENDATKIIRSVQTTQDWYCTTLHKRRQILVHRFTLKWVKIFCLNSV